MNKVKRVKSTDLQVLRSILNDEIVTDNNENIISMDNVDDNNKVVESKSCDNEIEIKTNDHDANKIANKEINPCKKKIIKTHNSPFRITRIESKHKSHKVRCENASMYSDNAKSASVQSAYKSVHYNNIVNTEKRLNRKYEDLAKLLNKEILLKTASLCDQSINEARQLIQNSLATSRIVSSFLVDFSESGRKIPIANKDRIIQNSDLNQHINRSNDRIIRNSDLDQHINKPNDRIIHNSDLDQHINRSIDRIIQNSDLDQHINKPNDRIIQNSDLDQHINRSNDRIIHNSDLDQHINRSNDRIIQNSDLDQHINRSNDRIIRNSDLDQHINRSNDRIILNSDLDQQVNKPNDRIIRNSDLDQQVRSGSANWIIQNSHPDQQVNEPVDPDRQIDCHVDRQIGNFITNRNRIGNGERARGFNIDSTVVIHNLPIEEPVKIPWVTLSAVANSPKAPRAAATDHMLTSDQPFIRGWLTNKNHQRKLERRLKEEQLRIERAISMSAIAVQQQRKEAAEESFRNWIKEKHRQGRIIAKEQEESPDTESELSPPQAGRQPKPTQMCMRRSIQMLRPKSCASFSINKEAKMKVSGQQMAILSNNFAPESCRCSTKIDYSKYISKKDSAFMRPETAVPQHRKKNFPSLAKCLEPTLTGSQKPMKKLKKKRKQLSIQTELDNNFPIGNATEPSNIYSDDNSDSEKDTMEMSPGNALGQKESIAIRNEEDKAEDSVLTGNEWNKVANGIEDEISDHFSSFGYESRSSS